MTSISAKAADPYMVSIAVPIFIAIVGFAGVVLAALISVIFSRLNEACRERRTAYASAAETLVAWAEYPYRLRRRTSDDPDELRRLADIGHHLQEKLRYHQTWVTTESSRVGRIYTYALRSICADVGPACMEAWEGPPITTPAAMNLGGWGPLDLAEHVEEVQKAIATRFGWRRLVPRWSANKG